MSAMTRLFLLVAFAIFHVPIIVTQEDSEVSVRMPDNETVVMMKINIKNNKTMDVDHGVSMYCSLQYPINVLGVKSTKQSCRNSSGCRSNRKG